jgi:hypothetical protein
MYRPILLILLALPLAGCSDSSSPTNPSPADAPGVLRGQTVNAMSGAGAGGLTVSLSNFRSLTTDTEGMFSIDLGRTGTHAASVRGNAIVERETTVSPSADLVRLSVIPASFDLAAFDEMFRSQNSRLQRWTFRPSLVVLASTMTFRSTSEIEFEATSEELSDSDVTQLVSHLTDGLALLTGNTFASFASVDVERPNAGARVSTLRTGKIVVGRYRGIVSFANTIGYGRWSEAGDGTIVGGAMYLDRDFDRDDSRRRLLRIHELGHALGYQHVRARTSIMNASIGPEPTDFDRAGAVIAFQRPPGNRSPDTDPSNSGLRTSLTAESGGRWVPPVMCPIAGR